MNKISTTKSKLRIAVLGAGQHSADHHGVVLQRIQRQCDTVELTAICDLDRAKAETYAGQFGFAKTYTNVEEMLDAEKPDGLVVITPVRLTASIVADLIPRRIPLMIEKPPGQNPDETRRLLALAQKYDTPHMVSFNRRFSPALTRAKQWLAENAADRPPQLAVARMIRYNRTEPTFVVDTGIHLVDATNCLMGQPTGVNAWNRGRVWAARVKYANESAANIIISPQGGINEETYELFGPDYSLRIDTMRCSLKIFEGGQTSLEWQCGDDEEGFYKAGAFGETEHFIDAIRQGQNMTPTLHDSLLSMLTVEAIFTGQSQDIVSS